ncbi:MAG: acyl-CoA dehydratase activase-related protein, partial [Porphyromonadaceae bacterium]|nr:acyl-CoA dehydratase activase-related protein [Porphyromonadaceae bacterium]
DRIFLPYVVYERKADKERVNSYNCPIVSGYSEIAKGVMPLTVPLDTPVITFKDEKALYWQCADYLQSLGVVPKRVKMAFAAANDAQRTYETSVAEYMQGLFRHNRQEGRLTVLLAGRPYHSDKLIQHKISDMIAAMGVDVISDDVIRGLPAGERESRFISQWAYPNRILAAARWAATQGDELQFIQLTSFGCGPDAFLVDEVKELLHRHGKSHTLLKIDDVNNIGSIRLRVRSVIESLKMQREGERKTLPFVTTPPYTEADVRRKIIVPFFTPFISPLIPDIFRLAGYDVEVLPMSDREAADFGLQYANNEICYPATLVVGDIVKAFKEGRYDPAVTAVAMTQTGGQCRATGYIALIKKALVDAGYPDVPVVSVAFGSSFDNPQPGFKINWIKLLPIAIASILFGDCMAKCYYASIVRETEEGAADRLRDAYMQKACEAIRRNKPGELLSLAAKAAAAFAAVINPNKKVPKVGIVGEIFLKFHAFAQKNITSWLVEHHIEVVPPTLTEFFLQSFVNRQVNQDNRLVPKKLPNFLLRRAYVIVRRQIEKFNRAAAAFPLFSPAADIFDLSRYGEEVIPLYAQFGEGWLLPAEVIAMAHHGVEHVVSLQPFGCIANHIVAKGVEKKIKTLYPQMNLLSLDFDSGVSDVNVTNRMLLFIHGLEK